MLGHIIGFPFLKLMQENGVMVWLTFMALGAFFIPVLSQAFAGKQVWRGLLGAVTMPAPAAAPAKASPVAPVELAKRPFALQYGVATGTFAAMGHGTGIAANSPVTLGLADAATNTIIFGGIGSGKTTRMINPLLLQILSQDAGALIFDIKTNFIQTTDYLATQAGREYRIVGDGGMPFNLLQGLTPEVAASFIKSAMLLNEGKSSSSKFWLDGAVEFCRNGLNLLKHIPERYSLVGLFDFVFDLEAQTTIREQIEDMHAEGAFTADEYRMIKTNLRYFDQVFVVKDEKEKGYINSTVANVLSPFQHPSLVDGFCTIRDGQAELEDLVNKGAVFHVQIPTTKYGAEGSRLAYLFIKLRFFQVMKERESRREWDQSRAVAFICDEYQAIIDPISDTDFWDKSRSAKTVGIVSMQGYSSMDDALGNEKATKAIIQNFREVICFRTEDQPTIERLQWLLGQVEVAKVSESSSSSESQSKQGGSSSTTSSRSVSYQMQNVINPQLFRGLGSEQAVALLNVNGMAFDDVINCGRIFVPKDWEVKGGQA